MLRNLIVPLAMGLAALAVPAFAQDSKAWLEAQGLEAVDSKSHQEFEAVVARLKGAKDAARQAGKGTPVKHPNPTVGNPHFHPTDPQGEKLPGSPHFEYPN